MGYFAPGLLLRGRLAGRAVGHALAAGGSATLCALFGVRDGAGLTGAVHLLGGHGLLSLGVYHGSPDQASAKRTANSTTTMARLMLGRLARGGARRKG